MYEIDEFASRFYRLGIQTLHNRQDRQNLQYERTDENRPILLKLC